MAKTDTKIWVVRAGEKDQAATLFLEQNYVAIRWDLLGDPSALEQNPEAYKAGIAESYPEYTPNAIGGAAGQVFRFVNEIESGHLVIYPQKKPSLVNIGRVTGAYRYNPSIDPGYPNLWPVTWLRSFPRTRFTQGALTEISGRRTVFQVRNFAEEFLAALES